MSAPANLRSDALRTNNFDLLRFLFAFIVFLVHAYTLSASPELRILVRWLSSEIAVQSFFVVSGFLIFMSYENSSSLKSYFEKRARRIYPAYFAVVVLAAIGGMLLTALPAVEYFRSGMFWTYLTANLVFLNFLQPELPGLFADNRLQAVNGALWTLKIEVMFYLSVPVIGWMMKRWGCWRVLFTLYVASLLYVEALSWWGMHGGPAITRELQRQLPGQLCWFMAGAALYYGFEQFRRWGTLLLLIGLPLLFFRHDPALAWLAPAALGVVVIYAACLFPWLGNFGKFGDFSYGIYIVHFPVLQALVAAGMFAAYPVVSLMLAVVLIMATSYMFWHGIEKPFLRKSSHYVEANRD